MILSLWADALYLQSARHVHGWTGPGVGPVLVVDTYRGGAR